MKTVEYLSPTSIKLFYTDMKEFYLNYLSDNRPPKIAQTQPMSVGSAFDAYVKSYLHEALFGKDNDPKYTFEALFEAQVEEQNRDFALGAGKVCFEAYKFSGALADLMLLLGTADEAPRFEFEVHGAVEGHREGITSKVGGVIFLGKPDAHFKNKQKTDIVLDWKVNGYCSGSPTSPVKGYVRCRDGWCISKFPASRGAGQAHKDAFMLDHKGININVNAPLDTTSPDWAAQLSVYSWLLGMPVGSDFVVAIDQLACADYGNKIRVAQHRSCVSDKFQFEYFAKAQHVWDVVHSDHIFRDMTLEDSKAQCEALDGVAAALKSDEWFNSVTRS